MLERPVQERCGKVHLHASLTALTMFTRLRAYLASMDMRHGEHATHRARAREVRVPIHRDHTGTVLACGWCGDQAGGIVVLSYHI